MAWIMLVVAGVFGDEATYARLLFVGLIIMGIVGLKLTSLT